MIEKQEILTAAGNHAHDFEIRNPSAHPKTCSFQGFFNGANWVLEKLNLNQTDVNTLEDVFKKYPHLTTPVAPEAAPVKSAESIVEENFKGLSDLIDDTDLVEWYKSLIVTCIEAYHAQFHPVAGSIPVGDKNIDNSKK